MVYPKTIAVRMDCEKNCLIVFRKTLIKSRTPLAPADELVMKLLGLDKKQYSEISDMIDKFPDKSDWDIAEAILFG